MNLRTQLVFAALGCVVAAAYFLFGMTDEVVILAAAWGLTFLVGFPRTTLVLLLATLSCDQVLTFRAGASFNLRLAHLCALALVLRLVFARLGTGRGWRLPLRPLQPLFLYLLVACVGAFWSANLPKTVGYLAWALADVGVLFALIFELARTEEGFRFVRRAWCTGALVAAGFGLTQLALGFAHLPVPLSVQRLGEFPRINGFNYEPAYYALYLESVAAVYLGRFVRGGEGAGKAGALGLFLLVPAALSMSRSGWLGMGLLLGYVTVHGIRRASPRALLAVVAALGLAISALGTALPQRFLAQAPKMAAMALDVHERSSTAPRLGMLGQAVEIFRRHPLLGVGLGGFGGYVVEHPELLLDHSTPDPASIVTSNLWLEIASEIGILGVGLFLWFLLSLLAALWRAGRFTDTETAGWRDGLMISVALVFFVLFNFNQTLWRLDVWVLLALAWALAARFRAPQVERAA